MAWAACRFTHGEGYLFAWVGIRLPFPSTLDNQRVARFVAGGQILETACITGVITRWPRYCASDVSHIETPDREFVAAEITAFMTAWILALPCPIINRPTALNLCGPPWRREEWAHLARRLDIPFLPVSRVASLPMVLTSMTSPRINGIGITVVALPPHLRIGQKEGLDGPYGDCGNFSSFGDAHEDLHLRARMLAESAGTGIREVMFTSRNSNALFISASLWPPIHEDPVLGALCQYFIRADIGGVPNDCLLGK